MKKSMKPTALKKIIVKCADFWVDELEIDPEVFDDVYVEAATRAIEKRKDLDGFKITVVLECWEKKDFKKLDKHFCYNTYYILINAGMYEKAEMLRLNFIRMHGIDLQKESLKGDNGDNGNTPNSKSSGSNSDSERI
jgi:hypothetical protein